MGQIPDPTRIVDSMDGSETVRAMSAGRWIWIRLAAVRDGAVGAVRAALADMLAAALASALAPVLARISALEAAGTAQAARDAAQDAALGQEVTGRQAADAAEILARQAVSAALGAETSARTSADTAAGARLTALENRPEEAAHFTGSARLPAITVLQPVTLTLTGLVPGVAGDRIRKGEAVLVEPAAALPAGANVAAAWAPADDTVVVQFTTGINLAAGTAPIAWNVTVLR